MPEALTLAAATMLSVLFTCVAWVWGANRMLDLIWPATGRRAGRNSARAGLIRPWLFLGPALVFMGLYLVWPVLRTGWLALHDATGARFVGLENLRWLASDARLYEALGNSLAWLLVVPAVSTALGLIAAVLTDGLRWGVLARAVLFMPMAISFVGAAVIWKFIYAFTPEPAPEIGLLNALVTAAGGAPQAWLTRAFVNDLALMVVVIWMQTGFAMVILSAALRAVPEETLEAARLDGAGPWTIFTRIQVPQIRGTLAVVWTAITIMVLKLFDIVFVMTNGQWGTQVLANLIYDWMFRGSPDAGRGAAVALVLMALVTPLMIWNIRAALREERA
ncbi:carbohydrate ABC transporter permease [Phaeovulum vinaykumarii]|uniref:Maltose ABC transporter membrane protein /trehalose ABC transporter membrane protein /sucrose ABC transporter membrane protein n=1 Tax=Phaeovulum vinaykumarii TaxID=407234 RepID=A0A1N7LJM2_9RHOB|nr:sugar ABC transporter permease [Phaeovulum vinaykumarii]SIS73984.1 maltose ABC transporter membrane protein /trehalose ABC transporter membrane protein /sucrose ABC transporter membrane protein [Phaeovulum vinaykumarii]SOC04843.1 maltose ABC transporter membrane protein /trehalose ABC transporter membrane protein /sucrose ABC transporter membrane protein [Phaeovulum vinaykumarii]